MMNEYNALTIEIYSSGTTRIIDVDGSITRASNIQFSTFYPGGLFGDASFYIPRDVTSHWLVDLGQRVVIRNGIDICYEGIIVSIVRENTDTLSGMTINCAGYDGQILGKRSLNKKWADTHLDESSWIWQQSASGAEKCDIDRYNRMRFTPRGVAWSTNEYAAIRYSMPTGQTVKRITMTSELAEGAQNWSLQLYDIAGGSALWTQNTSGTSGQDTTLSTPRQSLELRFVAGANQTPTEDGAYYAQATNVTVYSETGNINLTEIATDLVSLVGSLNSDVSRLQSNTFSLIPFITNGQQSLSEILYDAAAFGGPNGEPWAYFVLESEFATNPNGKPMLAVEQQPALSDYDYAIRLDDTNLVAPLNIAYDLESVVNWVSVKYYDEDGNEHVITPDDDSSLKDSSSISKYGERHLLSPLDANTTSETIAKNMAIRYLYEWSTPKLYVSGPVNVAGFVRGKNGNKISASRIRAGKRLKIENYLDNVSGTGMTFIISQTRYNDASDACEMSVGIPDSLSVFLARMQ